MIYLIRGDYTSVCETEAGAVRAEQRGFARVPYAAYRAARQEQEQAILAAIRDDDARVPLPLPSLDAAPATVAPWRLMPIDGRS